MSEVQRVRPFSILLVEDSPADARLLKEALKGITVPVRLAVVRDGVEAMDYLGRMTAGLEDRPDLVILDLNLPRKGGREVLSEIKSDHELQSLRILVMTSSDAEEDVAFAYRHDADSFTTKPNQFADYLRIARAIENFCFISERSPNGVVSRFPQFEPFATAGVRFAQVS